MDRQREPEEVERVLCFDAGNGEPLWTAVYACRYRGVSYDLGPRCTVAVVAGRVFAVGAMGHVTALDLGTGDVLWQRPPPARDELQPVPWGVSASAVPVGDLVVVQLGLRNGGCFVALEAATGLERWRAVADRPSYATPFLARQGGRDQLLCWSETWLSALDPMTGEVLWQAEFVLAPGQPRMNVASPVVSGNRVVLSSLFDGIMAFEVAADGGSAAALWRHCGPNERDTRGLHATITTPLIRDRHIYGVDSYGQFRGLRLDTGERVWEDLTVVPQERWATAHLVENGETLWIFSENGDLVTAEVGPEGITETSRAHVIAPTHRIGPRLVCWSHPAFAMHRVFVRNDQELVCLDLALDP
jgi:outer membrane protein assembly factor BamB